MDIDLQCGNEGSGGAQFEQNLVKNNFCAGGPPIEINIADMEKLQWMVRQDPNIKFGPAISMTDRTSVQVLGEGKLVSLKAFVFRAREERGESVNCKDEVPDRSEFHDIHITLVDSQNKPQANDNNASLDVKECTGLVVEVSPHHRPDLWTADNINELKGSLVRVTGQQFFDSSHRPCENGEPVGNSPKRISLWEIHPVYGFEVCIAKCERGGEWLPLDQWVQQNHSYPAAVQRTDNRGIPGLSESARHKTPHRLLRPRRRSLRD